MSDLNLAVIGNCSFGALIDTQGQISWACMPHFDGDPVFCGLLSGDADDKTLGIFDIVLKGQQRCEQSYVHNTAVLITTIYDDSGGVIRITDFAPRFKQLGRIFCPLQMVRIVKTLSGHPKVKVRLRPTSNFGADRPKTTRGSNHIRFVHDDLTLRLTTNAPVSYILEETTFNLEESIVMLFGVDESLSTPMVETAREFLEHTIDYWREWSRYLSIPFQWQQEIIRAAITLKLCAFEETGAVIAAMTTSIPESANSGRNWDYRYCWLRDSYFVVQALNRLGATKTMEQYLRYIMNIVADANGSRIQPVYGVTRKKRLVEEQIEHLAGYRGMGPVRKGNQAYEHIQNDVYGSVILAITQCFFDERLSKIGDESLYVRLESIGERCLQLYDQPDAGLWEYRSKANVHTHSSVMCWAGIDRMALIAKRLNLIDRSNYWRSEADRIREEILDKAYNQEQGIFSESWGGVELDASLLLMLELRFIDPGDERIIRTVEAIGDRLKKGMHIYRYAVADDFGTPEVTFNICTFWYIDALAAIGRKEEARKLFENMLACRNHVGLLSEDIDPDTDELWGNFPQTYSMVGLINSAMKLSISWREAF